ncbi:uncharacterized protein P174DRAFT_436703 [Aspergillus novofumigatus IBT 16806]|uniref:Uncharacterized protein n=1 Tax=Aspergillus novofumigatus (strain IBT 16806) TaxID=1392255 RepID=A0A2I1CL18_ASPN1|nr:uncharacterized protein P174DRAFT_436703 [Aspergillus novofumigatus IBT 16806]PKX98306.1 hypothetical protein P174DRAFT_436703 [Aspergillus novofumigatus IBT 16806]
MEWPQREIRIVSITSLAGPSCAQITYSLQSLTAIPWAVAVPSTQLDRHRVPTPPIFNSPSVPRLPATQPTPS